MHLLTYSTLFGTQVWFTFIAGIVSFKRLPRQQFSLQQSVLFPVYFLLNSVGQAVMLLLHYQQYRTTYPLQLSLLASMLTMSLINQLYIGPKTTQCMWKKHQVEREVEKEKNDRNQQLLKKLNSQFGMLHGISSLLNLLVFIGLLIYGIPLSNSLMGSSTLTSVASKLKLRA